MSPKKILIVEDSATEALRARLYLERAGFQVSLANDGKEGLAKATQDHPDLILLDALMPRVSGYEICGRFRLDPATASIPIVMITTEDDGADMPPSWHLPANSFIAKPYDPSLLVSKVQEAMQTQGKGGESDGTVTRLQEELKQAQKDAEAARNARSQFMATMSHELRTPLHEFMGMTDLVLGTNLTQEQRDYLNTAKTSANALLAIVSDILEFTDLDDGQFSLEEKDFDLWSVIQSTTSIMAGRAQEKGLEITSALSPDVPREVTGDPRRLRQVLDNLIGNAIKFTDRGHLGVRVELNAAQQQDVELHFKVSDTGVGIAKEKQEAIFSDFRQGDGSTTRRYGGVGLGLAISQRLVHLMGGRIWVESEVGQGSTFHFTAKLKRQKVLEAAKHAASAEGLHLRILLAEDSPTNQLIAQINLKKAGHTVVVANNGRKAVDALAQGQFDLILMDVAMPEMDGLEATRVIREQEKRSGTHIPIIAMTAFAMKEYQEKCHEAGMDGYVSKPVSPDELHRTITPFLARSQAAPAALPPINLNDALEIVGGDVDVLRTVVEMVLQETPELYDALKDAVARHDAHATERAAHKLKGNLANVGSGPAREVAQQLETMGTTGNLDGAEAAMAQLGTEIQRLNEFYAAPGWDQAIPVLEEVANGT